jgi:hypothetical protein
MDLKKKQNIMYPYMDLKKKQNSMYGVHESEKIFLCVAQGVEVARRKNNIFFWQFFSTCEKITQFSRCCKYQGGKI